MSFKSNIPGWERAIRILLGTGILSLVFVGPRSAWGWLGLIPLATAFFGFCPLYSLIGFRAAPRH